MYHHPDTACMEQNLNSVILRPYPGEKMDIAEAIDPNKTYRVMGYAYDGGGNMVQKVGHWDRTVDDREQVEVSLDGGKSWIYCIRESPPMPLRHGNKFWAWFIWYADIKVVDLVNSKEISVRAWNTFKNTQPEVSSWNLVTCFLSLWIDGMNRRE